MNQNQYTTDLIQLIVFQKQELSEFNLIVNIPDIKHQLSDIIRLFMMTTCYKCPNLTVGV